MGLNSGSTVRLLNREKQTKIVAMAWMHVAGDGPIASGNWREHRLSLRAPSGRPRTQAARLRVNHGRVSPAECNYSLAITSLNNTYRSPLKRTNRICLMGRRSVGVVFN